MALVRVVGNRLVACNICTPNAEVGKEALCQNEKGRQTPSLVFAEFRQLLLLRGAHHIVRVRPGGCGPAPRTCVAAEYDHASGLTVALFPKVSPRCAGSISR